jgi:hypothetical protein
MSFRRILTYRAIIFLLLLSFCEINAVASNFSQPVIIEKRLVREDTNQGGVLM